MKTELPLVAITGANRGLGLSLAREFATQGYPLLLHLRMPEYGNGIEEQFPGKSPQLVYGDLRDSHTIGSISERLSNYRDRVLVNNACIHCPQKALRVWSDAAIEEMVAVNLLAAMKLCHRVLQRTVDGSLGIVNVNSMVGLEPKPLRAVYGATKAGLRAFSDSLRLEVEEEKNEVFIQNIFLSRVRTRSDFRIGMNPEKVAKRMVAWVAARRSEDLILDGRIDSSLEEDDAPAA